MKEEFSIMIPGAQGDGARLRVVAPWDLTPITEVATASAKDIERALETAYRVFRDRDQWLPVSRRIEILEKTACFMEQQAGHLAMESAREGGKPLVYSRVEVARAIDGVKNCIEVLSSGGGREIPM